MGLLDIFGKKKNVTGADSSHNSYGQNNSANSATDVYLLIFSAKWCGPSKRFLKEINEHIKCYNLIDVDDESNSSLAEKYNIRSVPTTILMNTKGKVLKTWIGYDDEDPGQKALVEFVNSGKFNVISYPGHALTRNTVMPYGNENKIGSNQEIQKTNHLLALQLFLNQDNIFAYKYFNDKINNNMDCSFMWAKGKLYLGEVYEGKAASIAFFWFKYMAENNSSLFNTTLDLLNQKYSSFVAIKENISDMIDDIHQFGYINYRPDFDLSKNISIIRQLWKDCMGLKSFYEEFASMMGDDLNINLNEDDMFVGTPRTISDLYRRILTDFNKGTIRFTPN